MLQIFTGNTILDAIQLHQAELQQKCFQKVLSKNILQEMHLIEWQKQTTI